MAERWYLGRKEEIGGWERLGDKRKDRGEEGEGKEMKEKRTRKVK